MRKGMLWSTLLLMLAMVLCLHDQSVGREKNKTKKGSSVSSAAIISRPLWTPNRIADYITNNGQTVTHIRTGSAGMEWPAGSGNHIHFAGGVWVAGVKNSEIVAAGGEYVVEFQPGPIVNYSPGVAGTAADPNDSRYRLYIINQADVVSPLDNPDYANWPVADGAPVNPDGTPQLIGSSTTWSVFNDLDATLHAGLFESKVMGIEVQQTTWAFNRPDAFGDMMFFKFKIINKSGTRIDSTFVSFWNDIDIGDALDLVACDTTLSLGYNYKTKADPQYGVAPAIGLDFFQGPIVPGAATDTALVSGTRVPGFRNLPMTSFAKYINTGPPQLSDPEVASEAYSFMNGFDRVGDPIINPLTGQVTKFWHTGDPTTGTGWLDDVHGDKRFLMSAGPFTLNDGDAQEVVGGFVIAQGTDAATTVAALKLADRLAQLAYDNNFALPPSPPSPLATYSPDSTSLLLRWNEQAESYTAIDNIDLNPDGSPSFYTFQGYNVYQVDEQAIGSATNIKKIATFDVIDGVTEIKDDVFLPSIGQTANIVVQKGSDNGVQRYLKVNVDALRGNAPFIANRQYYYAVSAYGYNPIGIPRTLESSLRPIVVIPQSQPLGTALKTAAGLPISFGDSLAAVHTTTTSLSDGEALGIIVDPAALTGHNYEVRFRITPAGPVYDIWNTTRNVRVDSNRTNQSDAQGEFNYPIIDGILFKVFGPALDFKNFQTVANGAGPIDPPEGAAADFQGFPSLQPTANQQVGPARWFLHTFDNGTRGAYEAFVGRVTQSQTLWGRIIPNDFEIRFTPTGGIGFEPLAFVTADPAGGTVINLPFELWIVGDSRQNSTADDIRLIPYLIDFNADGIFNYIGSDHTASGGTNDPETDAFYWQVPNNRTSGDAGYQAFVTSVTTDPASYGFRSDNVDIIRRMVFVNWNGGDVTDPTFPANVNQALPETGTVFRIISTKPNTAADTYKLTAPLPVKNNAALARQQAALVNVFPNPYTGFNIEEQNPVERFVTFTHLSPTAKIRIFTLAGELVRTINHTDGTQFQRWDLRNANDIPVASGMYICHIELPNIGERILKLAVIQPGERIDVF